MITKKAPWSIDTRINNLKKTSAYIEAKESLVYGSN
jgi:hypothetical protein